MPASMRPEVVSAARAGAGWAFERLYGSLSPVVLGYLRSQGCSDPEATTGEVFLRVFRSLGSFEGSDAKLRSWVFAIAHNLVIDERRLAQRRTSIQPLHDRFDVPGGDAEQDALARLDTGRVRQILDLLPPDQRDVLLLRVVADLPLEDVAAATGRSTGAVKALQHRALASLRRRLAEILPEAVSRQGP